MNETIALLKDLEHELYRELTPLFCGAVKLQNVNFIAEYVPKTNSFRARVEFNLINDNGQKLAFFNSVDLEEPFDLNLSFRTKWIERMVKYFEDLLSRGRIEGPKRQEITLQITNQEDKP